MSNKVDSILASNLEESLNGVLDFMKKAPRRLATLSKKISECDLEISDLYHYIEIAEYDEAVFADLALQLKQVTMKRRNFKDEKRVLESTYKKFRHMVGGIEKVAEFTSAVSECIESKSAKPYKPRIREDLFSELNEGVEV